MSSSFTLYVPKDAIDKLQHVAEGTEELCTLRPWGKYSEHHHPVELTVYYRYPPKTALGVRLRRAYGKIKAAIVELLRG